MHEADAKLTEELHACFRAAERRFQSLHGRPSGEADEDEFILLGRPFRPARSSVNPVRSLSGRVRRTGRLLRASRWD